MNPHATRLAAELADAAWIMAGFDPPTPDMNILEPRFPVGKTFATAGMTALAARENIDLAHYIWRHNVGDWGDLCKEDKQANEDAIEHGGRILSSYRIDGRKIYVITEADRSMTTVLLAQEY